MPEYCRGGRLYCLCQVYLRRGNLLDKDDDHKKPSSLFYSAGSTVNSLLDAIRAVNSIFLRGFGPAI